MIFIFLSCREKGYDNKEFSRIKNLKLNPALNEFLWHLILVCVIYSYGQQFYCGLSNIKSLKIDLIKSYL